MEILSTPDIKEWIWYVKNSTFVATDSFHGVCFSMIYKKNFVTFAQREQGKREGSYPAGAIGDWTTGCFSSMGTGSPRSCWKQILIMRRYTG